MKSRYFVYEKMVVANSLKSRYFVYEKMVLDDKMEIGGKFWGAMIRIVAVAFLYAQALGFCTWGVVRRQFERDNHICSACILVHVSLQEFEM